MKLRITRISPSSLALTLAIFYFVLGLFIGLFGVYSALSGNQFTMNGPISFSGRGTEMLPFAIAYPFVAAIAGVISGFVISWIFNFISKFTKGLLIETDNSLTLKD